MYADRAITILQLLQETPANHEEQILLWYDQIKTHQSHLINQELLKDEDVKKWFRYYPNEQDLTKSTYG